VGSFRWAEGRTREGADRFARFVLCVGHVRFVHGLLGLFALFGLVGSLLFFAVKKGGACGSGGGWIALSALFLRFRRLALFVACSDFSSLFRLVR
jgi:hypothetical protein